MITEMSNPVQNAILSACREFLKPIARLLLKYGIGYREFSDICKAAFVEVASSDFGIRDRKTNMSRVAVMTGLSRKEVRKVRDAIDGARFFSVARSRRPELVLSIWHSDSRFLDEANQPKRITFDGAEPNFCDLVSLVGGDIPPRAMLHELVRAGSVKEDGDKLGAISRSYVPEPGDPESILVAGDAIKDLVSTIHHNLGSVRPEQRFFERRVYSERLPAIQQSRFQRLATQRGELLLQEFNDWMSEREVARNLHHLSETPGEIAPRIGVGVYFFSDAPPTSLTESHPSDSPQAARTALERRHGS
jgi:hypothetical protein